MAQARTMGLICLAAGFALTAAGLASARTAGGPTAALTRDTPWCLLGGAVMLIVGTSVLAGGAGLETNRCQLADGCQAISTLPGRRPRIGRLRKQRGGAAGAAAANSRPSRRSWRGTPGRRTSGPDRWDLSSRRES